MKELNHSEPSKDVCFAHAADRAHKRGGAKTRLTFSGKLSHRLVRRFHDLSELVVNAVLGPLELLDIM